MNNNIENSYEYIEEVKFFYEKYLDNIENAKKSQWQAMFYFFALQGFIFKFRTDLTDLFSIVASIAIAVLTGIIIYMYRIDIEKYQQRKNGLKQYFSNRILNVLNEDSKKNPFNMPAIMTSMIIITTIIQVAILTQNKFRCLFEYLFK